MPNSARARERNEIDIVSTVCTRQIAPFFLVYALLVFVYATVLNGQLEVTVHQTLEWDVARAVQSAVGIGEISPEEADEYRAEMLLRVEKAYGFDKPFLVRAGKLWLKTARLDFGHSRSESVTHLTGTTQDTLVMNIIGEALIPTLLIFGGAFLFQAILALFLGLRNGTQPGSGLDRVTTAFSILLAGVPPFVLAMFMVSVFVFRIPLAPSDPGCIRCRLLGVNWAHGRGSSSRTSHCRLSRWSLPTSGPRRIV